MKGLFSVQPERRIRRYIASVLVVVMVLSQSLIAQAETGSFTGETKRIRSEKGCQHNCWTDEACQDLIWQIMESDPDTYNEIREAMQEYGWNDNGYGPAFATDSDAEEDSETASPSNAEENTAVTATPSNAGELNAETATPSDAAKEAEKATDSDAEETVNSNYRIRKDGRLRLKACEHEHDDTCGYYAWKTTYRYEDEEVTVKAVVVSEQEEALPEGSELVVEKITEPEDIDYIAQKIAAETGRLYDCSQAYDIRFEYGGDEVEPENATVKVQLKYKESVPVNEPGEIQTGEEAGDDIRVLHLTNDDQIEDVTGDISKNMAGDLKSVDFETESFSIFVLTQVLPNGTFFQYEDEEKIITASVSNAAGIPSDAKLVVDVIDETDERYQTAKAQLEQAQGLEGTNVQAVLGTDLLMYDFYFLDFFDEKVDVAEDVEIQLNIQYRKPQILRKNTLLGSSTNESPTSIIFYQLNSNMSLNELNGTTQMSNMGMHTATVNLTGIGALGIQSRSNGYQTSNAKYLDEGNYSLSYILQHYNMFVSGNVSNTNEVIGSVIVGGTACIQGGVRALGKKLVDCFANDVGWLPGVWGGMLQGTTPLGGGFAGDSKVLLHVPSEAVADKLGWGVGSQERGRTRVNPAYIDIAEAFQHIESQVDRIATDESIIKIEKVGFDYTPGIYVDAIDVESGKIYELKEGLVNKVVLVNVTDDAESSGGNVIIVINDSGSVELPGVHVNGKSLSGKEFDEQGFGVVYILPNASEVRSGDKQNRFIPTGHVVAPKATFKGTTGDYNGCVISKNIVTSAEFHMHPYYGDLLETGVQFRLGKTVDSKTPEASETFTFILQNMTKNGDAYEPGSEIERVENSGGEIQFSPIIYSEAGTYYYRVSEDVPAASDDYIYDENKYYIKVVIEEVTDALGAQTGWKPTEVTYWKVDKDGKPVSSLIGTTIPAEISLKTVIDLTADKDAPAIFKNLKKETTAARFQFGKTVDGIVPAEEKFNFTLQPMQETTDTQNAEIALEGVSLISDGTPDVQQNAGGTIAFETIPYSAAGNYYYKVYENSGENQPDKVQSGYIFETNRFYIKVEVEETDGKLDVKQVTYWKADKENNLAASESITEFTGKPVLINLAAQAVFENKTKKVVVLPETGGAGTEKFAYTGFWLFMMGLMGMMYSGQKRRRKARK